MKNKHTFKVWFEQINQAHFTVKADNLEDALKVALSEWRDNNYPPSCNYVEKDGEQYRRGE